MRLKIVILFIFVLFCEKVYSQNNGFYKLKNDVKITEIEFYIPENHRYRLDKSHTLLKVVFHLINDTCCVKKTYSDYKVEQLSDEQLLKFEPIQYDLKLDKKVFFDIIDIIQSVDFDRFEQQDFNLFDGFTYYLRFGNHTILFDYQFYGLSVNKSNDAKIIYNLFEEIWEKYK